MLELFSGQDTASSGFVAQNYHFFHEKTLFLPAIPVKMNVLL